MATIIGSRLDDLVDATHTVGAQPLPSGAADDITGNRGNDDLSGLGGDDIINGGKGHDTLHGGDGDDTLQVAGKQGRFDGLDGGADTDTLQALGHSAVFLAGFDATADSIEIWAGNGHGLKGSGAADVFDLSGLTSISGLAFVKGGGGNDTLIGSNFADDLQGGKGDDHLSGGTGDDLLKGGRGKDTFVMADGDGADTVRDYKFGHDKVDLTGVAGVHAFGDLHLTQVDLSTVLVDFDGVAGGDTLTIQHTTIATLTAHQGDFIFA